MSRVPVLTLENAPEAARPFLQTALNNSGYIPNLLGVLDNRIMGRAATGEGVRGIGCWEGGCRDGKVGE
ncbi:hypothetical protein VST35_32415, partial [Pseudomonas aeruginosa]